MAFGRKLRIVCMHHLIDDSDEEQKDEFAEQFNLLMRGKNGKRIDVVLGDTNCELKTFDPEIHTPEFNIGRWNVGETNSNSERLMDLIREYELCDAASQIKKKKKQKQAFHGEFQGNRQMREYDHIFIPANYRASVTNSIVAWNTRYKSDHALLTIHMTLKPFTAKRKNKGEKCVSRVLANRRCAEIIDENLPSV